MKISSIGLRLTLWYAGILTAALTAFCAGLWLALGHSLYHAIDESLRDRVQGVRAFMEEQTGSLSLQEMREEFREHSVLGPGGDLFQVAAADGQWLYRSDPLYDQHTPTPRAGELGASARFENVTIQDTPLRFFSQNVEVQAIPYTVTVAAPISELQRGMRDFLRLSVPALPAVLLIAAFSGYWMSRRALRPVDKITETARSITADNLSRRLAVPDSGDELERLSRTLNEMIERLEVSFKRVSRFTADASHELRTPLTIMRTTAEVALRDRAEHPDHREALEEIVADLEQASQLVDNLLLIARADSNEAILALARVDIVDTIREASSQGAVLAKAKGVEFEARVPETEVAVNGDRTALRRLFLLLIDNAVKYTPGGGHVMVSLSVEGPCAVATVADTGIGIATEHLPHIFERFYRADRSRSREHGSAGLGLAIGLWIAEAHGGTLTASSQPPVGAVFTVRLPLCATPEQRDSLAGATVQR
jgi:heavy metal sensor kinase